MSMQAPPSGANHRQQAFADAYLSELLSYSLDRLKKEPELLKEEKVHLEQALQATAVSQHGAFLGAADCLETISTELSSVCDHLDKLLQATPQLASTCEAFAAHSSRVIDAHARNKQLANNQAAVLELLELPQLMDTCVRNGVYDEALDLQAYVARMGLLHADLPVVKLLTAQVADVSHAMLQQLLGRLKASIQLPECLRVMGYLRRMGVFSESDLRLQFLQCRDECMSRLVEELDDSDAYEFVKHLTDVHRLHLFDAVMQYRAIFFDSSAAAPAAASIPGGAVSLTGALATATSSQDPAALTAAVRESAMLHSWLQHRLSLFLGYLEQHLPIITDGGNLASVLEHCMYCGSSLARVGLDFQGLLLPLFEACSMSLLTQHLAGAVDTFTARLDTHKWVLMHTTVLHKARSAAEGVDYKKSGSGGIAEGGAESGVTHQGSSGELVSMTTADDPNPPYIIMEHLPLAVFTNGVLAALNELRQCSLQKCAKQAAGLFQQALEAMAAGLMHYRHAHALPDGEAGLFRSATKIALDVVLPYVSSCFVRVYAGTAVRLDTSAAAAILRQCLQDA